MTSPDLTAALSGAPQPRRPSGPLTFLSPGTEAEESWTPLEGTSPETADELLDPSPSDSAYSSDELSEDDGNGRPSSRASSGNALGKKALKAATIKGVLIGSEMAHRALARTEGQRVVGLFRADDEDAENIGDPLAELLHRRGGIAGATAAANPDVGDAIRLMMGMANLVSKQAAAAVMARQYDDQVATGLRPPADVE